ncbi:MAG: hypothetical protein AAF533_10910 [Acidobacteriota bacterium]
MTGAEFEEEVRRALASNAGDEALFGLLKGLHATGASRDVAQAALERVRAELKDEKQEDRVLEMLDVVVGFCSPHQRLWP